MEPILEDLKKFARQYFEPAAKFFQDKIGRSVLFWSILLFFLSWTVFLYLWWNWGKEGKWLSKWGSRFKWIYLCKFNNEIKLIICLWLILLPPISNQYVSRLHSLAQKIYAFPDVEYFNLIRLDCEDLKIGLAKECKRLANILLENLANKLRAINQEWVIGSFCL